MTKKERAVKVTEILNKEYGTNLHTYLHYEEPWQLLFATILSAQCTDDRVNMVTKELFKKYPDVKSFADADLDELMKDIFSTGFYRNKATNIIACAKMLLEKYDGEVPSDIDLLTALPGVGRKTANVIRTHVFRIPSIVVDTHVKRVSFVPYLPSCPLPLIQSCYSLTKQNPSPFVSLNQQSDCLHSIQV